MDGWVGELVGLGLEDGYQGKAIAHVLAKGSLPELAL